MMFGMGMFGIFFWILVVGLVIWGVNQIVQGNRNTGTSAGSSLPESSPLEILKQRYARGEITREQFEEMKKDLLS